MKIILKYFLATFILFSLSSCCSRQNKEISGSGNTPVEIRSTGQDIQINKSIVEAELINVFRNDKQEFIIKAKIISVKTDNAYPSIAVAGEEYTLQPSFVLDENKFPDNNSERNTRLLTLSGLKPGDHFSAEIFLEKSKGWFIRDLLK